MLDTPPGIEVGVVVVEGTTGATAEELWTGAAGELWTGAAGELWTGAPEELTTGAEEDRERCSEMW